MKAPLNETSVETLNFLAENGSEEQRHLVALNGNTPVETLARMAEGDSHYIHRALASNPNTPIRFLLQFALNPKLHWQLNQNPTYVAVMRDIILKNELEALPLSYQLEFALTILSIPA